MSKKLIRGSELAWEQKTDKTNYENGIIFLNDSKNKGTTIILNGSTPVEFHSLDYLTNKEETTSSTSSTTIPDYDLIKYIDDKVKVTYPDPTDTTGNKKITVDIARRKLIHGKVDFIPTTDENILNSYTGSYNTSVNNHLSIDENNTLVDNSGTVIKDIEVSAEGHVTKITKSKISDKSVTDQDYHYIPDGNSYVNSSSPSDTSGTITLFSGNTKSYAKLSSADIDTSNIIAKTDDNDVICKIGVTKTEVNSEESDPDLVAAISNLTFDKAHHIISTNYAMLPTTNFIKNEIDKLGGALIYQKGINSLADIIVKLDKNDPNSKLGYRAGYVYVVTSEITVGTKQFEVGDTFIAHETNENYTVPTGDNITSKDIIENKTEFIAAHLEDFDVVNANWLVDIPTTANEFNEGVEGVYELKSDLDTDNLTQSTYNINDVLNEISVTTKDKDGKDVTTTLSRTNPDDNNLVLATIGGVEIPYKGASPVTELNGLNGIVTSEYYQIMNDDDVAPLGILKIGGKAHVIKGKSTTYEGKGIINIDDGDVYHKAVGFSITDGTHTAKYSGNDTPGADNDKSNPLVSLTEDGKTFTYDINTGAITFSGNPSDTDKLSFSNLVTEAVSNDGASLVITNIKLDLYGHVKEIKKGASSDEHVKSENAVDRYYLLGHGLDSNKNPINWGTTVKSSEVFVSKDSIFEGSTDLLSTTEDVSGFYLHDSRGFVMSGIACDEDWEEL